MVDLCSRVLFFLSQPESKFGCSLHEGVVFGSFPSVRVLEDLCRVLWAILCYSKLFLLFVLFTWDTYFFPEYFSLCVGFLCLGFIEGLLKRMTCLDDDDDLGASLDDLDELT